MDAQPDMKSLYARVEKLERQNRWMKRTGIVALVLVVAVAVMGQAQTNKVIEANEFVLKDGNGKARARLSMEADSRPTLSFYDGRGHLPLSLAGGDEPFIVLNRVGTQGTVQLGANKAFYGVGIYEKEIRAGLSVQKGTPGLELFDDKGIPRAALEATNTGATLSLMGSDQKAFASITTDSSDPVPGIALRSPAGNFLVSLGEPAASLVLLDKNKKVLWSAP